MKIKLIDKTTTGEVLIEGKLDANTSEEVGKILAELGEKYETLVLNLEGLEYISSAGLRVVKLLHLQMKNKDGNLIIKNTAQKVMEVFEMSGFAGILRFE